MMKKAEPSILIVDQGSAVFNALKESMKDSGIRFSTADNGFDAIRSAQKNTPGLIVIDSALPKMNGIETGRILKQDPKFKNTYIYFLIGSHTDHSAISEFKNLADDCFLKPVNVNYLVHRIQELFHLEAKKMSANNGALKRNGQGNGLLIDRETYLVHFMGSEFSFPKKEFELLHLLASIPEKVFTRKDIFKTVWNKEIDTRSARTIDVHIRKLREKLDGINIVTIKGVGYKLSVK
jgi:two-component system alkaline phosphatase synthesis response regulator PhoP